jgi:hypothetical protein
MNAQYTQVGNAVPVPLGRAIAAQLADDLPAVDGRWPLDQEVMLGEALARLRSAARNKRPRRPDPDQLVLALEGGSEPWER